MESRGRVTVEPPRTPWPQWRQFFDKYDPEGFGEIPWPDFVQAMSDPEFRERVNTGKREILLEKYRTASTAAITFQDFVNVVSDCQLLHAVFHKGPRTKHTDNGCESNCLKIQYDIFLAFRKKKYLEERVGRS
ncbi:unnamed protein product [Acanthoscelides obtectus]|uniref:Uncharacterized protein n=1 Tax=Acanthoscelides obtectus TaxID=200917 RepID=A0A9P0Q229_ACAOB|nr:unnamed protein product [Acanthoscelides obtectus]CAK1664297.1 hypothetical protein AOBTE_LOCUS24184 [Acanthoscelides obtectus]